MTSGIPANLFAAPGGSLQCVLIASAVDIRVQSPGGAGMASVRPGRCGELLSIFKQANRIPLPRPKSKLTVSSKTRNAPGSKTVPSASGVVFPSVFLSSPLSSVRYHPEMSTAAAPMLVISTQSLPLFGASDSTSLITMEDCYVCDFGAMSAASACEGSSIDAANSILRILCARFIRRLLRKNLEYLSSRSSV